MLYAPTILIDWPPSLRWLLSQVHRYYAAAAAAIQQPLFCCLEPSNRRVWFLAVSNVPLLLAFHLNLGAFYRRTAFLISNHLIKNNQG